MKIKTQIVLTGMLCVLFSIKVNAQNSATVFKDTILITPNADCKILLIGSSIKTLDKYTRFDTLKTMLIADVEVARKNPSYPADSKTTHYFINRAGKRRLKAESDDYEPEIDIKKEEESLNLDLPPYLYIIHDFATGNECYIYLKAPGNLEELKNLNLNEALSMVKDKKNAKSFYRMDVERKNNAWVLNDSADRQHMRDFVELSVAISPGICLLGSNISPTINIALDLSFSNKYGILMYKNQLGISGYTFTSITNTDLNVLNSEFLGLSPAYAYRDRIMRRVGSGSSGSSGGVFLGLELGWLKAGQFNYLNNAKELGLTMTTGKLDVSFDAVWPRFGDSYYGLTIAVPFPL